MAVFSLAGDYIVAVMSGWPGLLVGLLALVDLLERSLDRRLLCSTRIKVAVGAVILIVGAIAIHPPHQPIPSDAAIEHAREVRAQQARDAVAHDTPEQRQRDRDSDERLKSEANSLREELATGRNRQR